MTRQRTCAYAVWATLVVTCGMIGGCPPVTPSNTDPNSESAKLERFQSASELVSFFRSEVIDRRVHNRGFGGFLGLFPAAADAETGGSSNGAGDQSAEYSSTNLQEEGVDEGDVIKSDGTYFYIAKGTSLRIVKAAPTSDLAQVGQLDFDFVVSDLYLYGGKLIVIGQDWGSGGSDPYYPARPEIMIWPPYYLSATTFVTSVDITDPAAPAVAAQNELDGSLASSRLTNDRLILILTVQPELPSNPTTLTVNALDLPDIMPQRRSGATAEYLVPPENWYRPASPDGYFTTAVVTLDAANIDTTVGSLAVMANVGTIYASTEALYLTNADYDASDNYRETTVIHKLSFDADGVAQYAASGRVPGRLLNQFSLSELDGYLRVATYVSNWQIAIDAGTPAANVSSSSAAVGREQSADDTVTTTINETQRPFNAVYVLNQAGEDLAVAGALENISPGERLYAARFVGERGYLVTYQQIDPLFVLDLATPATPTLVGELEIPGYSDYLHPFGDNLLIGVGRSVGMEWGFTEPKGVQLSLFNVSDPNNPTLIEQVELGGFGSSSDVSSDHKAFTFLPSSGVLAIPVQLWTGEGWVYGPSFDGVICYQVAADGFTELGRIASVQYDQWPWNAWRRAAIIGNDVYAITAAGVRAAARSSFATTVQLELTPNAGEFAEYNAVASGAGSAGFTEPGRPD
jgi:inhibitor of cysteine peptidase